MSRDMKISTLPTGMLQTNCIFLQNDADEILVIDPGAEPDRICSHIDSLNGTVVGYPLTHGNYDHVLAIPEVHRAYPAPLWMHPADLS